MPDRNCCTVIWVIRLSQKPKARSVGLESVNCFKKLCEDSWSRWLFDKSWTCRNIKDWKKVTKYLARMGSDYKSFYFVYKRSTQYFWCFTFTSIWILGSELNTRPPTVKTCTSDTRSQDTCIETRIFKYIIHICTHN